MHPSKRRMHPSKLPAELWGEIGKRLACRLDVASFRSVCKAWRSALPLPTRFPLRARLPPGASSNSWCVIAEIETYSYHTLRSPPRRLLLSFEAKDEPFKFRDLSGGKTPLNVKQQFSDHMSRFSFVAKSYCIRFPSEPPKRPLVYRVALISSNANGRVDANYDALSELSLVALLPRGKLALLRLENPECNWLIDFCPDHRILHIETYKGQLLAVGSQLRGFLMDYHSLRMTQVDFDSHREPGQIEVTKLNLKLNF